MQRWRAVIASAVAAFVALAMVAGAAAAEGKSAEAEVRAAFEAYAEAVAARDGKRALALTDQATLRYNDGLVEHARGSDRAALAKLRIVDQLAILRLRAEVPRATLDKMKGADLVRHGVEHDWSKPWQIDTATIERVAVADASATVATSGGQLGKTLEWQLLREGKRWRVSVISVLPVAEALARKMAKRFNKSDAELVELGLRMLTGKDVPPALWDPPR